MQKDNISRIKKWQKPILYNLSIKNTKGGDEPNTTEYYIGS